MATTISKKDFYQNSDKKDSSELSSILLYLLNSAKNTVTKKLSKSKEESVKDNESNTIKSSDSKSDKDILLENNEYLKSIVNILSDGFSSLTDESNTKFSQSRLKTTLSDPETSTETKSLTARLTSNKSTTTAKTSSSGGEVDKSTDNTDEKEVKKTSSIFSRLFGGKGSGNAATGLFGRMGSMLGGLGKILFKIVRVGGPLAIAASIGYLIYENWSTLTKWWNKHGKGILEDVTNSIKLTILDDKETIAKVYSWFQDSDNTGIIDTFLAPFRNIKKVLDDVGSMIGSLFNDDGTIFEVMDSFKTHISDYFSSLGRGFSTGLTKVGVLVQAYLLDPIVAMFQDSPLVRIMDKLNLTMLNSKLAILDFIDGIRNSALVKYTAFGLSDEDYAKRKSGRTELLKAETEKVEKVDVDTKRYKELATTLNKDDKGKVDLSKSEISKVFKENNITTQEDINRFKSSNKGSLSESTLSSIKDLRVESLEQSSGISKDQLTARESFISRLNELRDSIKLTGSNHHELNESDKELIAKAVKFNVKYLDKYLERSIEGISTASMEYKNNLSQRVSHQKKVYKDASKELININSEIEKISSNEYLSESDKESKRELLIKTRDNIKAEMTKSFESHQKLLKESTNTTIDTSKFTSELKEGSSIKTASDNSTISSEVPTSLKLSTEVSNYSPANNIRNNEGDVITNANKSSNSPNGTYINKSSNNEIVPSTKTEINPVASTTKSIIDKKAKEESKIQAVNTNNTAINNTSDNSTVIYSAPPMMNINTQSN